MVHKENIEHNVDKVSQEACEMRNKQLRFLRHMVRKESFENLAMAVKIQEKRGRERKRMIWIPNLKK